MKRETARQHSRKKCVEAETAKSFERRESGRRKGTKEQAEGMVEKLGERYREKEDFVCEITHRLEQKAASNQPA